MDDRQARHRVTAVEASLGRLDGLPPAERAVAHEAIAGICELYGEALRRVLDLGRGRDDGSWLVRFARTDELVSHLLLLHGLHPDGEEPLDKLLAAEDAATAATRPAPSASEPELVRLGTRGARERLVREPRPGDQGMAAPDLGHSGAPAGDEICELCAAPIPARHRHLLELEVERLRCVCTACALLFDRREAAMGRYRLVPDRVWRLDGFELDEQRWSDLSIPVGLAYLAWSSRESRVRGFYPGALGAVESQLGLEAWAALVRENPVLEELEPDVEALLVRRLPTAQDCWLVPLETCFELVALLRTRWRGLTGGERVWQEVDRFFEELADRARPVDREGRRMEATQSAAAV